MIFQTIIRLGSDQEYFGASMAPPFAEIEPASGIFGSQENGSYS